MCRNKNAKMLFLIKLVFILSSFGVQQLSAKIISPIGTHFSLFLSTQPIYRKRKNLLHSLGAIFDEENVNGELAFQSALFRENMYNKDIEFVPKVIRVSNSDTYAIEKQGKKIC